MNRAQGKFRYGLVVGAVFSSGCVRPMALSERRVWGTVANHYRAFFPAEHDTNARQDAGLLRPRFGVPAVLEGAGSFPLEILVRESAPTPRVYLVPSEQAQCVSSAPHALPEGAIALALERVSEEGIQPGITLQRWRATVPESIAPGSYDVVFQSRVDPSVRYPRAVHVRSEPFGPTLRIAHVSDLHIEHTVSPALQRVLRAINEQRPDAVVITGDLAHRGDDPAHAAQVLLALQELEAPVFVVLGNHDHGFSHNAIFEEEYHRGWSLFARCLHPQLFFRTMLGRWEFVGFDSGPSTFSPFVRTRGLAPEALERVRAVFEERNPQREGIVFFSHAPTRARLVTTTVPAFPGITGRMENGEALEQVFLQAERSGHRLVHLSGHTHWPAFFETENSGTNHRFVLRPRATENNAPVPITRTTLITAPAATRAGLRGATQGYNLLELSPSTSTVRFLQMHD